MWVDVPLIVGREWVEFYIMRSCPPEKKRVPHAQPGIKYRFALGEQSQNLP